jgi:SAM-dependent methyltransferase
MQESNDKNNLMNISKTENGSYTRDNCRLCQSKELKKVVPMPSTPVGGAFVSKEQLPHNQDKFSLDIYQCGSCGHVQLLDVVDPKILFSNYTYFSGKTSLVKHFAQYSNEVITKNNLQDNSFIVDIGSNDGGFLRFFKNKGMRVLGIDPAENVAKFANESGIETLPKMFNMKTAQLIKENYGKADVITANNVYAHTDDMLDMTKSVKYLLDEKGVFCFEVSYLIDVVDKVLLGTIFHEHLCYHTIKPLVSFLKKNGLELIDVKRVPIQGGSIICTAKHLGAGRDVSSSVQELIDLEESSGVYDESFLKTFSNKLEEKKQQVSSLISQIASEGGEIAAFGAARGGTLLTYLFDLGDSIKFIVDDDPDKQNFYSPGYHIPVLPTETIYKQNPDYIVILAWVHSDAIIENNKRFLEKGGKFITFFPELKVIGKENYF